MSDLLTTLRRMVGAGTSEYTVGAETFWTDEQLQDALDQNAWRHPNAYVHTIEKYPLVTILDGVVEASGWFQPGTEGVTDNIGVIRTTGGAVVSGWTIDQRGQVSFATNMLGLAPRYDGKTYDLNAAAADVLEDWAAHVKLHYDIDADGQTMERSQKHKQLLEQAKRYRARSLPQTVPMTGDRGRPQSAESRYRPFFERKVW